MGRMNLVRWCVVMSLLLILAGCGGGGGSSVQTVSGVAAAGSPLSGTVRLKDSSVPAQERSAQIAGDGSFSFDVTGMIAPFILQATGTAQGRSWTIYSFASSAGIANINPLSHLALVMARGNDNLSFFYSAPNPSAMNILKGGLPAATADIQTSLNPMLDRFGVAGVDFISAPYVANHLGLDLFLDLASITISTDTVLLTSRHDNTSVQASLSEFKNSSFDFIDNAARTSGIPYILPGVTSVNSGQTISFSAFVTGAAEHNFNWSVLESNGGTISGSGQYTAPVQAGTYHVRAMSVIDPSKVATATVTVMVQEVKNVLSIVSTGPGVYAVTGMNLANLGGMELEISYDPTTLANPLITQGPLTAAAMFIANPNYRPGTLKIAWMSLTPVTGSGTLATIAFDVPGQMPQLPVITRSMLAAAVPPPTGTGGTSGNSDTSSGATVGGTTVAVGTGGTATVSTTP